MAYENHWLPGFNFNVEEWDAKGQTYETLAICRTLALARAAFAAAVAEKPRQPLHDQEQDARGAAAPGRGLARFGGRIVVRRRHHPPAHCQLQSVRAITKTQPCSVVQVNEAIDRWAATAVRRETEEEWR